MWVHACYRLFSGRSAAALLSKFCSPVEPQCNRQVVFLMMRRSKVKKGKSEHLYSALHGIQTTLKHSGMDHTAFNLQTTPCQPLPRKRSPDGASTECGGGYLIAAHYSFIDPGRMKG